jgi:hypothetical protein
MSLTTAPNPAHQVEPLQPNPAIQSEDARCTRLFAGWSAIGFAALVITGNVVIGVQPARDASAAEVSEYVAAHRGGLAASAALYAGASILMLIFTTTFLTRLRQHAVGTARMWATVGARGALLIVPMFAMVLVPRLALTVGSDESIADPTVVSLLWRLEMAALSLNSITLAGALIGLSIAGARTGLVARWLGVWGPIAGTIGVIAVATTAAGLEGSPVGLAGLVTFVSWMVFLLATGVRQLRAHA